MSSSLAKAHLFKKWNDSEIINSINENLVVNDFFI